MAPKDSHPSNLTDEEWTRGSSDGEIFAVLRDGAGPKFIMRGYKSRMTDAGDVEHRQLPAQPQRERSR